MTRKDFALIALGFSDEIERLTFETNNGLDRSHHRIGLNFAAHAVADKLQHAFPRFDRIKFLVACGVI